MVESGAGPRLHNLHKMIEPQVKRCWRLCASSIISDLQYSINEHDEIIAALITGDASLMERRLQINWEKGRERLGKVSDILVSTRAGRLRSTAFGTGVSDWNTFS